MLELQEITDAWGKWMARKYNTTLHFTESTNYSSTWHLSPYKKYEVSHSIAAGALRFTSKKELPGGTGFDVEILVTNHDSRAQNISAQFSLKESSEFSWSVTEAVKIGNKVSGGMSVPFFADAKVEISAELSVSSTQGGKSSNEAVINYTIPVSVDPNSGVYVKAVMLNRRINSDWVADVTLSGHVAIRFNDYINLNSNGDKHALWFIPIQDVFRDVISNNLISTAGYYPEVSSVIAQAKGTAIVAHTSVGQFRFRKATNEELNTASATSYSISSQKTNTITSVASSEDENSFDDSYGYLTLNKESLGDLKINNLLSFGVD
ncbi:ETX/MTX2 family pore-forming toxin [Pseudomonas sp. RIT-PI-AD]|uniref:ETX/MTX2 family pore-forming toxin n=1 Tax=Pseudomonas sp. RIT-PI-AD TaxID=3035294 RepID=UPI0021DB59BC|nr:ETX/MTX2 family pore-forming toxin [Pseudomonas sp. RIT-PI-AD]